jgi:hypothetical protein
MISLVAAVAENGQVIVSVMKTNSTEARWTVPARFIPLHVAGNLF